jgi:hypothetical protein
MNSVDIWCVFGSFVYGFEGRLVSWHAEQLELAILAPVGADSQGAFEFFTELSLSAKGLLKSEIRIFDGSGEAEIPLLTLVTNAVPQVLSSVPESRVLFSDLRGLSENDGRIWEQFSRDL